MNTIPTILSWKKHFQHMAKGRSEKDKTGYYQVNQFGEGSTDNCPHIELVSPTQAVVDQAKADLKRKLDDKIPLDRSMPKKTETKKPTIKKESFLKSDQSTKKQQRGRVVKKKQKKK
jgi:hypothetical protein